MIALLSEIRVEPFGKGCLHCGKEYAPDDVAMVVNVNGATIWWHSKVEGGGCAKIRYERKKKGEQR